MGRRALMFAVIVAAEKYGAGFPATTLRIVFALPAGGPIDLVARHIAPGLAEVTGQLSMASASPGNLPHRVRDLVKSAARVDMLRVPYMDAAPAVADLVYGPLHGHVVSRRAAGAISDPDRFQAFARDEVVRRGSIAKVSGAKID